MKKEMNENLMELVGELEYLIGDSCYNPNSYDGWQDIEGQSFRYPINLSDKDGKQQKIRRNINTTALLTPGQLDWSSYEKMHYKFGSNRLYVGKAILKMLAFMEERYGVDFSELENSIKETR